MYHYSNGHYLPFPLPYGASNEIFIKKRLSLHIYKVVIKSEEKKKDKSYLKKIILFFIW